MSIFDKSTSQEQKDKVGLYYENYGPMVFRRCNYLLKNEAAAWDTTQDIFISLFGKKNLEINHPASFFFKMATNRCLNHIRDNKRLIPDNKALYSIAASDNFEKKFEAMALLEDIFSGEKIGTREIAVMKYIDKMTYEEISAITGISMSGIRKRLTKLHKKAVRIGKEDNHE